MFVNLFYAFFLLNLLNLNICGMEDSNSEPTPKEFFDSVMTKMMDSSPSIKTLSNPHLEEDVDINQFRYIPSEADKIIFASALKNAPEKVKSIIKKEMRFNPKKITTRLNRVIFVGPPGTGKSTLGKALGIELGTVYFITSGDLLQKHRHATSQRLSIIIKAIIRTPGKSVLVLDEINKLLENYASENNDSGDTAATLWEKMDANRLNPNFFLIGTANDSKKIPPQLQSRFRHKFVSIQAPMGQERKELILYFLHSFDIPVDKALTNENIDNLVTRTINFVIRDIESLCDAAVDFAYEKENPMLTLECLEKAFKERENDDKEFCDFSSPITDEERRHQESLNQNRAQFEENKEQQLKLAELNACVQTHNMITNLIYSKENGYSKSKKEETWEEALAYHKKIFPERHSKPDANIPAKSSIPDDKPSSCNVM